MFVVFLFIQPLLADIQLRSVDHHHHIAHIHTRGKGGFVFSQQIAGNLRCQSTDTLPGRIDQQPFGFLFSF